MKETSIRRRTLLALLLRGSTATLAAQFFLVDHAAAESSPCLEPRSIGTSQTPSFRLFFALSQLVTQRRHPDASVAQRLYPLFREEPWGSQHMLNSYAQLCRAATAANPGIGDATAGLGKAETWFTAHLLTTWYLGVYYHDRMPPRRVAYSEALMFEAVGLEMPRRFVDATGYGAWSVPPPTASRR